MDRTTLVSRLVEKKLQAGTRPAAGCVPCFGQAHKKADTKK